MTENVIIQKQESFMVQDIRQKFCPISLKHDFFKISDGRYYAKSINTTNTIFSKVSINTTNLFF